MCAIQKYRDFVITGYTLLLFAACVARCLSASSQTLIPKTRGLHHMGGVSHDFHKQRTIQEVTHLSSFEAKTKNTPPAKESDTQSPSPGQKLGRFRNLKDSFYSSKAWHGRHLMQMPQSYNRARNRPPYNSEDRDSQNAPAEESKFSETEVLGKFDTNSEYDGAHDLITDVATDKLHPYLTVASPSPFVGRVENVACSRLNGIQLNVSVPHDTPAPPYIERHGGRPGCNARHLEDDLETSSSLFGFWLEKLSSCGTVEVKDGLFYNTVVIPKNTLGIELGTETVLTVLCRIAAPVTRTVHGAMNMEPERYQPKPATEGPVKKPDQRINVDYWSAATQLHSTVSPLLAIAVTVKLV